MLALNLLCVSMLLLHQLVKSLRLHLFQSLSSWHDIRFQYLVALLFTSARIWNKNLDACLIEMVLKKEGCVNALYEQFLVAHTGSQSPPEENDAGPLQVRRKISDSIMGPR